MGYFLMSFKSRFVYRNTIVFNILGSILSVAVQLLLWKYLYAYEPKHIAYMQCYIVFAVIIGMGYSEGMAGTIGGNISNGSFAIDLVRPINFWVKSYCVVLGEIAASFILRGIPLILVLIPIIWNSAFILHCENIFLVLVAVLLGHYLYILIFSIIGYVAFWVFEIWPFARFISDTIRLISGAYIPLALFPKILRQVAYYFPFRFMYDFPLSLLLNESQVWSSVVTEFCMLIGWIAILTGILVCFQRCALRRTIVQGG